MSDMNVRDAVFGELAGLDDVDVVVRGAELIELLNRHLVSDLADERAKAVTRLRRGNELDDREISERTGVSPQQLRKLEERGVRALRLSAEKTA